MMDLRRLRNTLLYRIWHGFSEKGNIISFFSQTFTIHRTAGEGEAISLTPLYHFHLQALAGRLLQGAHLCI